MKPYDYARLPAPDGHDYSIADRLFYQARGMLGSARRAGGASQECIALHSSGPAFRNEMEAGPAGRQVQIEDPDGNPMELFEPFGR